MWCEENPVDCEDCYRRASCPDYQNEARPDYSERAEYEPGGRVAVDRTIFQM